MFYDVNFGNLTVDTISYDLLRGNAQISLFQEIQAKFLLRGIFPFDNYRDPTSLDPFYAVQVTVYPFLKVLTGLDSKGFTSTPEARYKVGTYSYIYGWEIVEKEPSEPPDVFPYYSEPHFICYERTSLPAASFSFVPGAEEIRSLEVKPSAEDNPPTPTNLWFLTSFYSGTTSPLNLSSIAINLNPSVEAELTVIYKTSVVRLVNDPQYGNYVFTYS